MSPLIRSMAPSRTHSRVLVLAACAAVAGGASAQGQPVAMSATWGQAMCAAWNADPTLTDKLVESGWIKNDVSRGYKTMQIYRADCPKAARVEMQIALKDGKAQCVYGGAPKTTRLDGTADYVMWAETSRWREMGAGEYGPMKAMMFGRLNFDGPNFEAMGNMGPFASFLRLVGKVPGDWSACP